MESFSAGRIPRIVFGDGAAASLAAEVRPFGRHLLLLTGARSFCDGPAWGSVVKQLDQAGHAWCHEKVSGEPSPEQIDGLVRQYQGRSIEAVIGIGGGSVLDTAKAVAGLLPSGDSILRYLEGFPDQKPYEGPSLPFIAVPTTCGTGSEATRNAVVTRRGIDGFKRSFRDERLTAQVAIVDPTLMRGCPRPLLAGNALDAFTQLLEAFVSIRAVPISDALAWSGMEAFCRGMPLVWQQGSAAGAAWSDLAYAALCSGICLAQAGLGAVHGLAASLGSRFEIPHGVACGALLSVVTEANIKALRRQGGMSVALAKYARVGRLVSGQWTLEDDEALNSLLKTLRDWDNKYDMPSLDRFGVTENDLEHLVRGSRGSSMKTNPVILSDAELHQILTTCLRNSDAVERGRS